MAAPNVLKDNILETFIRLSKINYIRNRNRQELHTFLILTKFPHELFMGQDRFMWEKLYKAGIYIGTTITGHDKETDIQRCWTLLNFRDRGFKVWLSIEPILGPVHLKDYLDKIDQVIAGGETGPYANKWDPAWLYQIQEDCFRTETPFFFKNWGEYHPGNIHKTVNINRLVRSRTGPNRDLYYRGKLINCNNLIWANQ
jgi:protein gp37